ncbi:PAS domain S-box protein [Candidatus Fermentibacteria bacterium]|nr:PAS domain S-box protein [Candidatus Fermentibacteria bacterium]
MTIRRTIPIYIGLMAVAIMTVSYGIAHVVMARSFARVERWEAEHSLSEVMASMEEKLADLDITAAEWATRGDCHGFTGAAGSACLRALIEQTNERRGIEIAAVVSPTGTIVEAYARSPLTSRAAPIHPRLSPQEDLSRGFIGHDSLATHSAAGFAWVDGEPTMLALHRLPSTDEDSSQAALVVGRRLSPGLLRAIGERTGVTVSVVSPADSGFIAEWAGGAPMGAADSRRVVPLHAGAIAGYANLPVLSGYPTILLRAAMPRPVHHEVRHALLYYLSALGIVAIAFSLLGLVVSEKLVLERLSKLAASVRLIGTKGAMSARVWPGGSDELADLGRAINAMLDSLQASQETLRLSEERFRRMADSIADGLTIIEGSTTAYINDRACEIFGYSRDELLCMQGTDLAAPEELERLRATGEDARLRSVYPQEITFWIRRKDGTRRCVQNRYSLSREGETVTGRFVVTTDVTERILAEQELERLRGFNERIVQTMAEGIVVDDLEGRYTYVNPAAATLLGYEPEDLVGRPWREVIPRDQHPVVEEANRRRAMGDTDRYELEIVRKDGSRVRVLVSGSPLLEAGEFAGTIAVFTDITERKREEQERERLLQETQKGTEQIHRIMDTVPDGVVLADENLRILLANLAAQEYLAALTEFDSDSRDQLGSNLLAEVVSTPPGTWHEFVSKGGDRRFELAVRPLDSQGWVFVIREVTHERAARQRIEETERVAAIGKLAAGIAHDFNNILSGVIGYSHLLLRDSSLTPSAVEKIRSIAEQGQRGAELVGQILDYTRQSLLDRSTIDLSIVVAEAGRRLGSAMPGQIRVSVEYPAEPCWVSGSAEQLQRVILNMAFNARDAMPRGGDVRIDLATALLDEHQVPRPEMSPGNWAILRVSDTGNGIPPEHLPRLFQPYFTTKDVGKGRGLGLAQAYGLVRQHDGYIEVATGIGQGTTCAVYLPLLAAVPQPERDHPDQGRAEKGGNTVLLVEDETAVLEVGIALLEQLGYAVRSASAGPEAIDLYRHHAEEIDLVLTDIAMPGMDGIALLEQLVVMDPSVKVLVVTGYPLDEASRRRLPSACVGWLQKPVTMDKLKAAVESALGR